MPQALRLLKPHFHTEKKRFKRWPKRKTRSQKRNLVLSLLTGDKATFRGLSERTGIEQRKLFRCLSKEPLPRMPADTAQRIARALGVSTDLFLDVLRVYTGWPNNRKSKAVALKPDCPSIAERLEEEKR